MILPSGEEIYVFDNNGITYDRYTIVLKDTSVYDCCEDPFGVFTKARISFKEIENSKYNEYEINDTLISKVLTLLINKFRSEENHLYIGKETTNFDDLPEKVKKYILTII